MSIKITVKQLFIQELPRLKEELEYAKSMFQVCRQQCGTFSTMSERMDHLAIYYKLLDANHEAHNAYYQAYSLVLKVLDSVDFEIFFGTSWCGEPFMVHRTL